MLVLNFTFLVWRGGAPALSWAHGRRELCGACVGCGAARSALSPPGRRGSQAVHHCVTITSEGGQSIASTRLCTQSMVRECLGSVSGVRRGSCTAHLPAPWPTRFFPLERRAWGSCHGVRVWRCEGCPLLAPHRERFFFFRPYRKILFSIPCMSPPPGVIRYRQLWVSDDGVTHIADSEG